MPRRSTSRMTRRAAPEPRPTLRDIERATAPALVIDVREIVAAVAAGDNNSVEPRLHAAFDAGAPALFYDSTGLLPSVTIARHGEVYAVEQLPHRAGGLRLFANLRAALKDGFTFARNQHA